MSNHQLELANAPLGQKSTYHSQYKPDLLFPIPRQTNRNEIGVKPNDLPFQGNDYWNAFEISWLNAKGKPIVMGAEFTIPCTSPHLIESKSFKLYLNSFNNTSFESVAEVERLLIQDLSKAAGAIVGVKLFKLSEADLSLTRQFTGVYLDELDIDCDTYHTHPEFLKTESEQVTETLFSDLLKSNCLVTGQPDWGSVQIIYTGKKIQHAGLLKYLISFRNHNEFHEQCVERIFMDIMKHCQPEKLFVYARYTRRGGLDINPYRANYAIEVKNERQWRQ